MSLPYDANTSYVQDAAPAIAADDLNDLQRDDVLHHRILTGEDFYLCDDFTGTDIDLTKWIDGGAFAKLTIVNRAGASGALRFLSTTDADNDGLDTKQLNIGTADFRFVSRVEVVSRSANQTIPTMGLLGGAGDAYFSLAGTGNWIARCNAGNNATTIAAPGSGTFQVMDIRRKSGVITFLIDGVVAYEETVAINMTAEVLRLSAERAGAGNVDVNWDYAKLWFAR